MICCVFFVFKQKTAYEMRISDWSSDGCSSDLTKKCWMIWLRVPGVFACACLMIPKCRWGPWCRQDIVARLRHALILPVAKVAPDRKSVAQGKSVSVRVGIGGRRIITTKGRSTHKMNKTIMSIWVYL